jgi:hypothetical protein
MVDDPFDPWLVPEEKTWLERTFLFLENGIVLTVVGLVGGFAGVFVDGHWFVILCVPLLAGLHRSSALNGLGNWPRIAAYVLVCVVSLSLLWLVGIGVNRSREHIPTVQEIGQGVVNMIRPSETKTAPEVSPTPPPPPRPRAVSPKPYTAEPKPTLISEVNSLADEIANLSEDSEKQYAVARGAVPSGVDSTTARNYVIGQMQQIDRAESERYHREFMESALSLREQMLKLIPDIPLRSPDGEDLHLNTIVAKDFYEHPPEATFTYRVIANNLRELAESYGDKTASKSQ